MDTEKETSQEEVTDKTEKKQELRTWLFKKGQSGNPKGRPKGTFSLKARRGVNESASIIKYEEAETEGTSASGICLGRACGLNTMAGIFERVYWLAISGAASGL